MSVDDPLLATLERHWGYPGFRPMQERIIRSLLSGHDLAAVMPTGGGKSLCYQLPAVVNGGTAVVISPLIALMQDQAAHLQTAGIPAAFLNSSLSWQEQSRILGKARKGAYRLIYLSPERLMRDDTAQWLVDLPLSFFAVDEAHCISEWGHEFRPEYRRIGRLRDIFPDKPIAAFTASATQQVRHDILRQLRLRDPHRYIASFHRPNLQYTVRLTDSKAQIRALTDAIAEHTEGSIIVYAGTIARVEEVARTLNARGIPTGSYHGQMDADQRQANQDDWMAGDTRVMVGTLAFGLGINKPDVRAVVHLSLPKSLEQYYQESGRAGRDGDPASCYLFWQKRDAGLIAHFIDEMNDAAERQNAWARYRVIRQFAESDRCRHRQICEYFGEVPKWSSCGACDVCGGVTFRTSEKPVKQPSRTVREATQPDEALLARLREWRKATAKLEHVPAYYVLLDATLSELARLRPGDEAELAEVKGIGPRKLARYGADVLRILRA
ncbi:MAG TPA: ATP-dependent DNA helicase RecQ [Bryobacteraceae bacterium]|nr:ATP-dependent DNA helicase RecQ [Bryobacteraceae bacterium]